MKRLINPPLHTQTERSFGERHAVESAPPRPQVLARGGRGRQAGGQAAGKRNELPATRLVIFLAGAQESWRQPFSYQTQYFLALARDKSHSKTSLSGVPSKGRLWFPLQKGHCRCVWSTEGGFSQGKRSQLSLSHSPHRGSAHWACLLTAVDTCKIYPFPRLFKVFFSCSRSIFFFF